MHWPVLNNHVLRPTSGWPVIRPESGSLGYSAHLKHSVIESEVLQQSSRPTQF